MKKFSSIILATAICAGIGAPVLAQAAPMSPASADHGGKASGGGATLAGVKKARMSHSHCRWVLHHPSHYRASTVRACRGM